MNNFRAKPMSNLRYALLDLDCSLTGVQYTRGLQTAELSSCSDDDFLHGREYYLSDGGYSRVVFNPLSENLFLTSNSRNEVKAKWNNCKVLRDKVLEEVRKGQE